MRFVRKGDPGKQKRRAVRVRGHDDEDGVQSYTHAQRPLSPRSLSKLKKFAHDEGSGNNYASAPGRKGVTSFLSDSNKKGEKTKARQIVTPKGKQKQSQSQPKSQSQSQSQSQSSSQSKTASKLSSFGKWN